MTNTERLKAIASLYQAIGQDDDANAVLGMMDSHAELISTLKQIASVSGEIDVVDQAEDAVEKAEAL